MHKLMEAIKVNKYVVHINSMVLVEPASIFDLCFF